ncbi:hypothetical protein OBBRIDRAFT_876800 [Obba rivulosa]|uniref:Uncharacterized protein n=1 Tax=Obba rivulosa TaxID=1052685 RepID=A0A8E2AUM8_9APHY|nr:hypothetical protein OBBRIDRAFT_876800 [Obba rivulosa]
MEAGRRSSRAPRSQVGMLPNMTTTGTDLESDYQRVNNVDYPGFFSAKRVSFSPPSSPRKQRREKPHGYPQASVGGGPVLPLVFTQPQDSAVEPAVKAPPEIKQILQGLPLPGGTKPLITPEFPLEVRNRWCAEKRFDQLTPDRLNGIEIHENGTINYGSLKPTVVFFEYKSSAIEDKYNLKLAEHGWIRSTSVLLPKLASLRSFHLFLSSGAASPSGAAPYSRIRYLGVYRAFSPGLAAIPDAVIFQCLDFDDKLVHALAQIEAGPMMAASPRKSTRTPNSRVATVPGYQTMPRSPSSSPRKGQRSQTMDYY